MRSRRVIVGELVEVLNAGVIDGWSHDRSACWVIRDPDRAVGGHTVVAWPIEFQSTANEHLAARHPR
ncbi:hypothetical protein [Gordonia alkanivorans]|uniref:hypothetical protein n=1 Tax=Gordonia alkanivorans TaxID=84096 RepID=UPI001F4E2A30|nr:hypothetical protein [Gordonia alkanivorans]